MSHNLAVDFGADPSGQTDTNYALGYAACIAGGKTHLDKGVYALNNPVHIHAQNGQRAPWLDGEGQNATILLLKNPDAPAFIIGDAPGNPLLRWPRISNMQIVYETDPSVDQPMFLFQNCKGLQMENVWFRNYRTLFQLGVNGHALAGSVEDAHFVNVKADPCGSGNTVSPDVLRFENFNGAWFVDCSISGALNQVLMHFTCEGTTTIDTLFVANCLFKDGLTGVRAGDGTASNAIFNGTIFDKIESVAVHLETKPDRDLTNWQFDGGWYHSVNFGMIFDQRAGGHIVRASVTGGSMDRANTPFTILGGADVRRTGI